MYKLTVESHFDAAHALRGYQGKCEKTHGHRFRVTAHFTTRNLNEIGLGCDFAILKKALNDVLAHFDHTNINDDPDFATINPSSENLAETIYRLVKEGSIALPARLYSIEVWESPDAGAEYRPNIELL
jgi:6-pyruvoyltetrahydropterin/6-carboxytetrahydropterin synthase